MQHKLIIVLFISLFSFSFSVSGQKNINSPYSRFNIGTLRPTGPFKSAGMGGVGTALRANTSIFYNNPASYTSLDTNSFVLDFGGEYIKNRLFNKVAGYSSLDLNFDHLLLGFPLAKGVGFAAGIVPVSSGYYNITESVLKGDPGYDPTVGEYTSYHTGDGEFSTLFIGTGIKVTKNLSAGINMNLLFGEVNRNYRLSFADFYHVYNDNSLEKLHLGGINFDLGLQYSLPLKNDYYINAGASLKTSKHYNTKFEQLTYKTTAYNTRDTVTYVSEDSTLTYIPGTLRLGIAFGKKNKFTTGFDFVTTKWSKSSIPGPSGYAADTRSFLFGAEYIPEKFSNYSVLKRIEYRIGGHIANSYLIIDGVQLKEYGGSIGLGIPMRRTTSRTNVFFDYTRKYGTSASNLPTEDFYTIGISLNLYDFWFMKRRYD